MTDRLIQIVRALYYIHGFNREFPGKDRVISLVDDWERRYQRGDAPKATDAWDRQYATGEWDYMGRLEESSRYAVIVGYLSYLARDGAILDVGCGDGVLFHRVRPQGYGRYVGFDLSDVAVQSLSTYQDDRTVFLQGDGDTFEPDTTFDAIVFNESLYYLQDPIASVHRYARHLTADGVMIASLYQESRRANAITSALKKHFTIIDASTVQQGAHTWECLVMRPAGATKTSDVASMAAMSTTLDVENSVVMLTGLEAEAANVVSLVTSLT